MTTAQIVEALDNTNIKGTKRLYSRGEGERMFQQRGQQRDRWIQQQVRQHGS